MTTKAQIKEWYDNAQVMKAAYVIVACDTFSYEDYPVYVMPDEDIRERVAEYNNVNMQRIMEIYDMNEDFETQRTNRPDLY